MNGENIFIDQTSNVKFGFIDSKNTKLVQHGFTNERVVPYLQSFLTNHSEICGVFFFFFKETEKARITQEKKIRFISLS